MNILVLNRNRVIKQTVQNMVEAGVVMPEEAEKFTEQLQQLDPKDLLAALLESHMMKDQLANPKDTRPMLTTDVSDISMN